MRYKLKQCQIKEYNLKFKKMSKSLILSLLLVCSLFISMNGLKINQAHNLASIRQAFHLCYAPTHLDSAEDFNKWLEADEQISSAHNDGKPLSDDAQSRLKEELKTYPDLLEEMLGSTETNQCIDNLTHPQKQKIYGWILDEMDLSQIFVADSQPTDLTDEQWSTIGTKAAGDKDILNTLMPCFGGDDSKGHKLSVEHA